MPLSGKIIESQLDTQFVGRPVIVVDRTGSTNADCLDHADRRAANGLAILANEQTQGRGRDRLDDPPREWNSPPGLNIYTSILFRPSPPDGPHPSFSLAAGLAVADAVVSVCGIFTKLKWPNDVLVQDKKLAGILVQTKDGAMAVGVGINVNAEKDDFGPLGEIATSLVLETGMRYDRNKVAVALYREMEKWYNAFEKDRKAVVRTWADRARIEGCIARHFDINGSENRVTLMGLDDNGFLIARFIDGQSRTLSSGEVHYTP